jgi:hypothetical protein
MGIVEAKIQTVEDMYRPDLDGDREQTADQRYLQGSLPAVLSSQIGPQSPGPASRTLLSIWRGQRERFGADWLAGELALCDFRETEACGPGKRFLEDRTKPLASGHLHRRSRYRRRRSRRTRSTERTLRKLPDQKLGEHYPQGGNRIRIMPLGANAATRAGGSPVPVRGQRIQDDRRGQRGKNGSARRPGTHKLQYRG